MNQSKNLASAAVLFLETANTCLTDSQYDQLQEIICQILGNEVVEAMLMQKISKSYEQITIKKIYNPSQGIAFIKTIRKISDLTVHDAKQYWDMILKEKPVSIKINTNYAKEYKEYRTQQLLKLSQICFFVIE